jgi:hypothetical protein
MTAAEDKVKRLAKVKSNTVCPNCGTQKSFGFGSVCIKFHTFICNECKSSHQAISHRCKSTTMSSWTDDEVAELERKGNDHCRRTWLKNAPPCGASGRPQPGCDLAVYKRFVVDAYEYKRFYGQDDGPAAPGQPAPGPAAQPAQPRPSRKKKTVIAAAPASAPLPRVVDLLDFSAPAATTAASVTSNDIFAADFSSMATQAPPYNNSNNNNTNNNFSPPTQIAASNDFSNLSGFTTTPIASAPVSAGFNLSSLQSTPGPSMSDFDGLSTQALASSNSSSTSGKKPIMGSGRPGSGISMMGGPPPQQQQQQQARMQNPQMMQQGGMNPQMMMQQGAMGMNPQMMMQQGAMGMNPQMMMQQGAMGMNPQMMMQQGAMGMNPQMMNPQMQQQFMMNQQMAARQQQMMGMNNMNQQQMGGMNQQMGGMNQMGSGGMTMMNNGNNNMLGGGMNNAGSTTNPNFTQQRQQTMNDNGMPGGNVMNMMAYTQNKKK